MAKLLVTNGCSFTIGDELPDPPAQAWPTVLGGMLGLPHVNLARSAASNRRIVRSTVMRLDEVRREHGVAPEDVLVVIAWTQTARHEYHSSTEPLPPITPPDHPTDFGWHRVGPWLLDQGHKPAKAFYDMMWSEEGQMTNFLTDWVMLDSHLTREGYRMRYAFAFPVVDPVPEPAAPLMDALDPDRVWGGLPPAPGKSFREMPKGLPWASGGHPLQEGHAWFAGHLADWLAERR